MRICYYLHITSKSNNEISVIKKKKKKKKEFGFFLSWLFSLHELKLYIYIYIYYYYYYYYYYYIMRVLVVSKLFCGYVSNQVQYNMERAQYLG